MNAVVNVLLLSAIGYMLLTAYWRYQHRAPEAAKTVEEPNRVGHERYNKDIAVKEGFSVMSAVESMAQRLAPAAFGGKAKAGKREKRAKRARGRRDAGLLDRTKELGDSALRYVMRSVVQAPKRILFQSN